MAASDLDKIAQRNVRAFTLFRMFFSARFYYPVYALLFLDYGLTLEQWLGPDLGEVLRHS